MGKNSGALVIQVGSAGGLKAHPCKAGDIPCRTMGYRMVDVPLSNWESKTTKHREVGRYKIVRIFLKKPKFTNVGGININVARICEVYDFF